MSIFVIVNLFSNLQITEGEGGVGYYNTACDAKASLRRLKKEFGETNWRFKFEEWIEGTLEEAGYFRQVLIPSEYKVMSTDEWRKRGRTYEGCAPQHIDYDARYWQGKIHDGKVVANVVIKQDRPHYIYEDGSEAPAHGTFCY